MRGEIIKKPELVFQGNNTFGIPIKGLLKYGPYDGRISLKLFILTNVSGSREDIIKEFIKYLIGEEKNQSRINSILFENVEVVEWFNVEKSSGDDDDLVNKIMGWRKELSNRGESYVMLQILNKADKSPTGLYWKVRKMAIGRYDSIYGLPIQTITFPKIKESKENHAIIENILLALYTKAGYRPWVLYGSISDVYPSAIYVGFDISYSEKFGQKGMGGVVVFDSIGQVIEYFETEVQVDEGDKISRASFIELIESIINSARVREIKPELVVIHRDGNFKPNELEIIRDHFRESGLKYIFLNFPKRYGSFPVFKKRGKKIFPADEGFMIKLGYSLINDQPYPVFALQSLPNIIAKNIMPNVVRYALIQTNIRNKEEVIDDIAKQVYGLTKLNYATKFGVSKYPATIHLAHKVAQYKRNGISIADFKRGKVNKPLWMI